ncbi:MAG: DUF4280 domain-containing protein, partial [Fibromonadaceae bacterium]|nr:DUF4280 domain-containing protein [Fibromonadaceae bacterium]
MAYYVCKGAKLKCSMGSEQSELEVVHMEKPVLLCGKPMANIMDYKPMVNIKPFGQCKSLANPVVAAATAANYGRLQEMPCIPNTSPWIPGKPNLLVKGQPALMDNCKCMCMWASPIGITDAGQSTVKDGGPMTITITEPTLETQQALGMAAPGGLASGLQPAQPAGAGVAMPSGLQPVGLPAMALPNLQPAALLGGVQLPQIPSIVTEIKGAAETLLQKVVNAAQSGNDIRSSAAADSSAKAKETKAKGESKAKEAAESYKAIVKVEGEGKASQGQEVTYKAIVYDKDG